MRKGPSDRPSLGDLPLALRRRFGRVPLPATLPGVWVVSPGGVGTTALMAHPERVARVNARDDGDALTHLPRPPRLPPGAAVRFLVIPGPADAICDSLARRGRTSDQAANPGAPLARLLRGAPQRRALSQAIARQRRARTKAPPAPTLCLDHDDLWEAAPRIAALLGIADPVFLAGYPRRKPRTAPGSDPA